MVIDERVIRKRLAAVLTYLEQQEKFTTQDSSIGMVQEDSYLKGTRDALLYVLGEKD